MWLGSSNFMSGSISNLAHAAAANERQDFVSAEAGAGGERHAKLEGVRG